MGLAPLRHTAQVVGLILVSRVQDGIVIGTDVGLSFFLGITCIAAVILGDQAAGVIQTVSPDTQT